MKKADVKIGTTYVVKVSGLLVPVTLDAESPHGGWTGTNTKTGRQVRIRTAAKLRRVYQPVTDKAMKPDRIRALRDEAGSAGDLAQVDLCDRALNGDTDAAIDCASVLDDAEAQEEPDSYEYGASDFPNSVLDQDEPEDRRTVSTGCLNNRKVTPGKCFECGFDDCWNVDGRGTIYCDCQKCVECGTELGGHSPGCTEAPAE